jgi:hypothetical protein
MSTNERARLLISGALTAPLSRAPSLLQRSDWRVELNRPKMEALGCLDGLASLFIKSLHQSLGLFFQLFSLKVLRSAERFSAAGT